MEIGSFIEMEFHKGKEYYHAKNVVRLNSGRAGIFHAARVLGCDTFYLPQYQCDTVRDFLLKKKMKFRFYSIDENFNPLIEEIPKNTAIVIVNYYGVMSSSRMESFRKKYKNIIYDNSQAFYCKPIEGCMNVYSARKFFGVPDGAYVVGENVEKFVDEYEQDYSSDTAGFLLKRNEYGCDEKTYEDRMINERRVDESDIKMMSVLTQKILDGTDYENVVKKRKENFKIASKLFAEINKLNVDMYHDNDCVPMVYPLVVENDELLPELLSKKIFQGHWWSYLLGEVDKNSFEYWLSRYIVPITIDQRYGEEELKFTYNTIVNFLGEHK